MSVTDTSATKALIIGESLVDLIRHVGEDGEPVGHAGGSPFNVAVTLGRLDRPVELVTNLADDSHGRQIVKHLHESNVRLGAGTYALERTSTALALIGEGGGATYTFDFEWTLPGGVPLESQVGFVHAGSISAVMQPGGARVLDALQAAREQALVSYDPNIRPTIMEGLEVTLPQVEDFVRASDLVKVSDEDLDWLYPGKGIDEAVSHWFSISDVALVVVTGGAAGPTAWSRSGQSVNRKPAPIKVVDTVGAGDSFMGGLLDALWRRGWIFRAGAEKLAAVSRTELEEILDEASAVANITVSRAGANPPWAHELQR